MVTKAELESRLREALRSGAQMQKRTLRMVLAAWKLAEVEAGGSLDEATVLALFHKEAKARRETIEDAGRARRPDLVRAAEAELAFLESFMPRPLTDAELEALVREAIRQVGAQSPEELGRVMKILMPNIQGRADGKTVSQTVRNLLTAP